ncbi:MAG: glycoside hydrolase family 3 protein [Hellea sp.]|nr:glycoside hydrolase family 3 protein [Hellea sp.]
MTELAAIFGLQGPSLSAAEKAFFRDANPWAFILFARNIETPDQVKNLTNSLRDTVGRECLIFIDQEGGRVQRLRSPHWYDYPSLGSIGSLYEMDREKTRRTVFLHHCMIAADLREVGINANCAPVLDIPIEGADPIISDRALGATSRQVLDLGQAALAGLMTAGVAPVIKHIPGHGRATVDSHLELPIIQDSILKLASTDFVPFIGMQEAPMAMTAHLIVEALDRDNPVTVSPRAISYIREKMGYSGLLMSDDLDMKALSGNLTELTRKTLKAGCDVVLQCSGKFPSMVEVAKGARILDELGRMRAKIAEYCAEDPRDFDYEAGMAEYESLIFRE